MNIFIITISIIAFLFSCFSIYACWKFVQGMKNTDDNVEVLDKKIEENKQLIIKAIKKGFIDQEGNLRKEYAL